MKIEDLNFEHVSGCGARDIDRAAQIVDRVEVELSFVEARTRPDLAFAGCMEIEVHDIAGADC